MEDCFVYGVFGVGCGEVLDRFRRERGGIVRAARRFLELLRCGFRGCLIVIYRSRRLVHRFVRRGRGIVFGSIIGGIDSFCSFVGSGIVTKIERFRQRDHGIRRFRLFTNLCRGE